MIRINAARFNYASPSGNPDSTQPKFALAVIKKIPSNWEQGEYVQKGGWATQPGATSSDYHLARACAEKLIQAKTAAQ